MYTSRKLYTARIHYVLRGYDMYSRAKIVVSNCEYGPSMRFTFRRSESVRTRNRVHSQELTFHTTFDKKIIIYREETFDLWIILYHTLFNPLTINWLLTEWSLVLIPGRARVFGFFSRLFERINIRSVRQNAEHVSENQKEYKRKLVQPRVFAFPLWIGRGAGANEKGKTISAIRPSLVVAHRRKRRTRMTAEGENAGRFERRGQLF